MSGNKLCVGFECVSLLSAVGTEDLYNSVCQLSVRIDCKH